MSSRSWGRVPEEMRWRKEPLVWKRMAERNRLIARPAVAPAEPGVPTQTRTEVATGRAALRALAHWRRDQLVQVMTRPIIATLIPVSAAGYNHGTMARWANGETPATR